MGNPFVVEKAAFFCIPHCIPQRFRRGQLSLCGTGAKGGGTS
jgi:hypothetical protein